MNNPTCAHGYPRTPSRAASGRLVSPRLARWPRFLDIVDCESMDVWFGLIGVVVGYVLAQVSTSLAARNRAACEDEATFNTLEAWLWRNEASMTYCLEALQQELVWIGEHKTLVGPVSAPTGELLLFLMPRLPREMAKDADWLGGILSIANGTDHIISVIEHRNLHGTTNRAMSNYLDLLKTLDEDIVKRGQEVLDAAKVQSKRLANRKAKRQILPWLFRG
jgi:hypothetical protein